MGLEVEQSDLGERSADIVARVELPTIERSATEAGISNGVPANPVTEEPSQVSAEEASTVNGFWLLLSQARYEIW